MRLDIRMGAREDSRLIAEVLREAFRPVATRFGLTPGNCPTQPSFAEPDWTEWEFEVQFMEKRPR